MNFVPLFNEYFNNILRNALKYPEKFSVGTSYDRIFLHPSMKSKVLLDILIANRELTSQILNQITVGLRQLDPFIREARFAVNGSTIVIILERDINPETIDKFNEFDVGVYSNIASRFDTDKQLDNFCISSTRLLQVCKNSMFWSEMLKQRFPQYHVEGEQGYNWEKVYRGLLELERGSGDLSVLISKKYHETLKYLILHNMVDVTSDSIINYIPYTKNKEIILRILEDPMARRNMFSKFGIYGLSNHILDIPIMTLFISRNFIDKSIIKTAFIDISQQFPVEVEQFVFYFDYLYPKGSITDMLYLMDVLGENYEIYEYVVSRIPDDEDPLIIISYISKYVHRPIFTRKLIEKFHKVLKPYKTEIIGIISKNRKWSYGIDPVGQSLIKLVEKLI